MRAIVFRSTLVIGLLLGLASLPSQGADPPPTDARGTAVDSVFEVGELDNVNLFNGNMTLTIPVGPDYPLGGGFSYGLKLVYNSLPWEVREDRTADPFIYTYPVPARTSNAGLGWTLTLGMLFPPQGGSGGEDFHSLSMAVVGPGYVTGTAAGEQVIDCGGVGHETREDCLQLFDTPQTVVTLQAHPDPSHVVVWSGDAGCSGGGDSVQVEVSGAMNCTATFEIPSPRWVSIRRGIGDGSPGSQNPGTLRLVQVSGGTVLINCPTGCTEPPPVQVDYGTQVRVEWLPVVGYDSSWVDRDVPQNDALDCFTVEREKTFNVTVDTDCAALIHESNPLVEFMLIDGGEIHATSLNTTGTFQCRQNNCTPDSEPDWPPELGPPPPILDSLCYCQKIYPANDTITVTAVASQGSPPFDAWFGICGSNDSGNPAPPFQIGDEQDTAVCAALFRDAPPIQTYDLTVRKFIDADGTGTVNFDPPNFDCHLECAPGQACPCTQTYQEGNATVTLSPQPDPDSDWVGWVGVNSPCETNNPDGTVTLNLQDDETCLAMFTTTQGPHNLNVDLTGLGFGTVRTVSPSTGIDCSNYTGANDCDESFVHDELVYLYAEKEPLYGSGFGGWSGPMPGCDGTNPNLQVTMSTAGTCLANFTCTANPPDCAPPFAQSDKRSRATEGGGYPDLGKINDKNRWMYVAPDGSRHYFYQELLSSQTNDSQYVLYTADGSFLRLRIVVPGVRAELEAPDGITRVFEADGDDNWSLTRIEDTFGNWVDIDYVGTTWVITDSIGRSHTVTFDDPVNNGGVLGPQVEAVHLEAFGNSEAVYGFSYGVEAISSCYRHSHPNSTSWAFPLLAALDMPEGLTYEMPAYGQCGDGSPGSLEQLNLPTGGAITWGYGPYFTVRGDIDHEPNFDSGLGVTQRTFWKDTALADALGSWVYYNKRFQEVFPDPIVFETETSVAMPDGSCTVSYFLSHTTLTGAPVSTENRLPGWSSATHGLSTRTFDSFSQSGPIVECTGTQLRSTYLAYELGGGGELNPPSPADGERVEPSWSGQNPRVIKSRTVFHDDSDRWIQTDNTDYNSWGNFGSSKTTKSGFGGATWKSQETDWVVSSTTPPAEDDAWLLDLFTEMRSLQSDSGATETSVEQFDFDSDTGFLSCRRTLLGSLRDETDVLVSYGPDADGNVMSEGWSGGDVEPFAGTDSVCGSAVGVESIDYRVYHAYSGGALASSQHEGVAFKSYDATIDSRTGLPAVVRDTNGQPTTFNYDELGRVLEVDPPGGLAKTCFTYSEGVVPAEVAVRQRSACPAGTLYKERILRFDAFGRLEREAVSHPDNGTVYRHSLWDAQRRRQKSSIWTTQSSASHASVTQTRWTHDPFGRPLTVLAPDDALTTFEYWGTSRVRQTTNVRFCNTCATKDRPARKDQYFDAFGRLRRVLEHKPGLDANYTYDERDRLIHVALHERGTQDSPQERSFTYDNRGFLVEERHPEKNNLPVVYSGYDARGHATSKTDADQLELLFDFDDAERLLSVRKALSTDLETFTYDHAGSNGAGRLHTASRFNRYPAAPPGQSSNIEVSETFSYGSHGLLTGLDTEVQLDSLVSSSQSLTYHPLGLVATHTYPSCDAGAGCPSRTLNSTYVEGLLTGLGDGSGDWATDISYLPSGLYGTIQYPNAVNSIQVSDPSGMARPGRIRTVGATQDWDSGDYSFDNSGNIHHIGSWSYSYDKLSRLKDAVQGATRSYIYDEFGNVTSGPGNTSVPTDSATNRLSDASYDGRGNLTAYDTLLDLTLDYDALDMPVVSGDGGTNHRWYAYTASGERVWKISDDAAPGQFDQLITWRDPSNKVIRDLKKDAGASGFSWAKDTVYRNGQLLGAETSEGRKFYHLDHLGTPRVITDGSGTTLSRHDYWPYGIEMAPAPDSNDDRMKFTGHERDFNGDSGVPGDFADDLDYMHARYYSGRVGRFLSVDPAGGSAEIPVPQSWNRYGYVVGNPLGFRDPNGQQRRAAVEAKKFDFRGGDRPEASMLIIPLDPLPGFGPDAAVQVGFIVEPDGSVRGVVGGELSVGIGAASPIEIIGLNDSQDLHGIEAVISGPDQELSSKSGRGSSAQPFEASIAVAARVVTGATNAVKKVVDAVVHGFGEFLEDSACSVLGCEKDLELEDQERGN